MVLMVRSERVQRFSSVFVVELSPFGCILPEVEHNSEEEKEEEEYDAENGTFGVLAFLPMGKRLTREGGHIDAALALAE